VTGPRISTHVLDTARGHPAAGVRVVLDRLGASEAVRVGEAETNGDGRIADLARGPVEPGRYRLAFDTSGYLAGAGERAFLQRVVVEFEARAGDHHYHIPLLLAPFGATTYRGS
jgi:5-hydroxyisourate hydrolase